MSLVDFHKEIVNILQINIKDPEYSILFMDTKHNILSFKYLQGIYYYLLAINVTVYVVEYKNILINERLTENDNKLFKFLQDTFNLAKFKHINKTTEYNSVNLNKNETKFACYNIIDDNDLEYTVVTVMEKGNFYIHFRDESNKEKPVTNMINNDIL